MEEEQRKGHECWLVVLADGEEPRRGWGGEGGIGLL